MKTTLMFLLLIFLSFSAAVFAQDDGDSETPICKQPFSTKFDEFEYTNLESAKEKLDLFGLQIKNLNARAVIIGYGGRTTEGNQGRSIAADIEDYISNKFDFPRFTRIAYWNGGHREKPFVELFIKPDNCSSDPEKSPTLKLDEVTYKEETDFFGKDFSQKSIEEMKKLLTYKVDPPYPAAARAVRASGLVLLFVVVDEKGSVIKTQAIDGHPLLRQASENAVKQWKYQIQKEENKPIKFGGKVIIDFDEIAKNNPLTIY